MMIRHWQVSQFGHRPFTAGLEVDDVTGLVVSAAPILRWTIGKPWAKVQAQGVRRYAWAVAPIYPNA